MVYTDLNNGLLGGDALEIIEAFGSDSIKGALTRRLDGQNWFELEKIGQFFKLQSISIRSQR